MKAPNHVPPSQHCHIVTGVSSGSQIPRSIIQAATEEQSDPPTLERGPGCPQPSHRLPSGLKCPWPCSSSPAGIWGGIGASSRAGQVIGESGVEWKGVFMKEKGCEEKAI